MPVSARMFPSKAELLPRVAELPTTQNTLSEGERPATSIRESGEVISVLEN